MPPFDATQFLQAHGAEVVSAVRVHAALSGSALVIAALLGVPLGIWSAHSRTAASVIVSLANAGRVVPSLAVLTLVLPVLGLGFAPALVALTLLALPPLLINTYV